MSAYLDILIYALVAGILFFWLFSVLGKRTGYEKNPEELIAPEDELENQDAKILDWPKASIFIDDNARAKVQELKEKDPNFSEHHFIAGAKYAFETILMAFSSGDLEILKTLLSPETYKGFETTINERKNRHDNQVTRLENIKEVMITDAYYEDPKCYVTVRYVSEQINVTYDEHNRVLEGDPDHFIILKDLWTFKRDPTSTDPIWLLAKTRSE
jgi:predicted lipid-binding transport protein (Tim44 family)